MLEGRKWPFLHDYVHVERTEWDKLFHAAHVSQQCLRAALRFSFIAFTNRRPLLESINMMS